MKLFAIKNSATGKFITRGRFFKKGGFLQARMHNRLSDASRLANKLNSYRGYSAYVPVQVEVSLKIEYEVKPRKRKS